MSKGLTLKSILSPSWLCSVLFVAAAASTSSASLYVDAPTPDTGGKGEQTVDRRPRSVSLLPIAIYDSDIGLGLGAKAVMRDYRQRTSFDVMTFASTEGEQRYAFAFSIPDAEMRQGTQFGLALDVVLDFDKLAKSNYFGIGNMTQDNDHQFPRESLKSSSLVSWSISRRLIGGAGIRVAHYVAYDYELSWQTITGETPGACLNEVLAPSVFLRFDTRDSWINPRRGIKIELQVEQGLNSGFADWDFWKTRLEVSGYQRLLGRSHILAGRLWLQQIDGKVPYQELSKVGDGWTARGYKADRFLDKAMALASAEYRFPIYEKLGGVFFTDTGRVWPRLRVADFDRWHSDVGGGLRYYLANFVARLDSGTSREGTRIFFNFGHVF